jgi:hypothetical protein
LLCTTSPAINVVDLGRLFRLVLALASLYSSQAPGNRHQATFSILFICVKFLRRTIELGDPVCVSCLLFSLFLHFTLTQSTRCALLFLSIHFTNPFHFHTLSFHCHKSIPTAVFPLDQQYRWMCQFSVSLFFSAIHS